MEDRSDEAFVSDTWAYPRRPTLGFVQARKIAVGISLAVCGLAKLAPQVQQSGDNLDTVAMHNQSCKGNIFEFLQMTRLEKSLGLSNNYIKVCGCRYSARPLDTPVIVPARRD